MATKPKATPRAPTSKAAEAAQARLKGLTPTEDPGVYRNASGTLVDHRGIMLSFLQLKQKEDKAHIEVLGHPVATPAQYLKAVALDPRVSMGVRLDAAKAAAPYTDRKMPSAVDGGVDPNTGAALPLFPPSMFEGLSDEAIKQIKAIFATKDKS